MAKHIKIGEPVNEAERWAFNFLAQQLPDSYAVVTNLEILAQSGQPLEVDALIIGEFALYLVDVKGYVGHLEAGINAWTLDGRWVDNSLSKANYVARVLAGRIRERTPQGVRAPWCQGMVLATGQEGRHIRISRNESQLCAFTPDDIIPALTQTEFLTSRFNTPLTTQQRDYSLEVIGKIGVMATRQNHIQDFIKGKLLGVSDGIEIWEAQYTLGEWSSDWLLKRLQASQAESPEHYAMQAAKIKDEFYRLQQLSGISGVPTSAPLINDGEQVVLPVKRPRGIPLSLFDSSQLDIDAIVQLIRRAVVSIQQIHSRGCTIGLIGENNIFVSQEGDLEFLDINNDLSIAEDINNFRQRLKPLATETKSAEIIDWFEQNNGEADLGKLRLTLNAILAGQSPVDEQEAKLQPGNNIGDRYELVTILSSTEYNQLWRARHIAGRFDCVISFYNNANEYWPHANEQYSNLMQIHHPSIARVFDSGVLQQTDSYFIARAWIEGSTLSSKAPEASSEQLISWITSLLTALQYLHTQGLTHRNIKPNNIICAASKAVLVNFSGLPHEVNIADDLRYTDPSLSDTGCTPESDLYSLIISFLSVAPGAVNAPFWPLQPSTKQWLLQNFGNACANAIQLFLDQRPSVEPEADYLSLLGLDQIDRQTIHIDNVKVPEWIDQTVC